MRRIEHSTRNFQLVEYAFAGLLLLTVLVAGIYTEREARARFVKTQEAQALLAASHISSEFARYLDLRENLVEGIAGALSLEPEISELEYDDFIARMTRSLDGIVNVALVRDGLIWRVSPYAANADVLGRNLRSRPDQMEVIERAIASADSLVQGPVRLLQGFDGFILRKAIWPRGGEQDAQPVVASIVFDAAGAFEAMALAEIAGRYHVKVSTWDSTGNRTDLVSDESVDLIGPVVTQGGLGGLAWSIEIVPVGGWPTASPYKTTISLSVLFLESLIFFMLRFQRNMRVAADRSVRRLGAAIDVLPHGFALFDPDDRLDAFNSQYLDIYRSSAPVIKRGAKFEDIVRYGLARGEYAVEGDQQEAWLRERMQRHLDPGGPVLQKIGDGRWLQIVEMKTADGSIVGLRIDITDQVQLRERAELAEKRLREAISALPIGFLLFDANGLLVLENGNVPHSQSSGARWRPSVADYVVWGTFGRLDGRPAGTGPSDKAGMAHWIMESASFFEVQTPAGRWHRYYVESTSVGERSIVCLDIDELRRSEAALRIKNDELLNAITSRDMAEQRFDEIGDLTTEWLWELGPDLRVKFLSSGFLRATGYTAESMVGLGWAETMFEDTDGSLGSDYVAIQQALTSHQPFNGLIYRARIRDRELWIRASGRPRFDEDGQFEGYRGAAGDVSQLFAALKAARSADSAKTQFLSVVSHELRTPLTVLLGYNAFLGNLRLMPAGRALFAEIEAHGNDPIQEKLALLLRDLESYTRKMQVAGQQLQALINDLIDIVRIETNTVRIETRKLEVASIAASTADQLRPLAEEKALALNVEVERVSVIADENRLRQVLMNLAVNGLKFTENGSVTIRAREDGEFVLFEVADTGPGIPEAAGLRLFERFYQVDGSFTRSKGGLGLGLAICRDLVMRQGGRIWFESELGKGTSFFFTLPSARTRADALP